VDNNNFLRLEHNKVFFLLVACQKLEHNHWLNQRNFQAVQHKNSFAVLSIFGFVLPIILTVGTLTVENVHGLDSLASTAVLNFTPYVIGTVLMIRTALNISKRSTLENALCYTSLKIADERCATLWSIEFFETNFLF
jgi:uncharacterized membrane protein